VLTVTLGNFQSVSDDYFWCCGLAVPDVIGSVWNFQWMAWCWLSFYWLFHINSSLALRASASMQRLDRRRCPQTTMEFVWVWYPLLLSWDNHNMLMIEFGCHLYLLEISYIGCQQQHADQMILGVSFSVIPTIFLGRPWPQQFSKMIFLAACLSWYLPNKILYDMA
jgi:hypothetical protein